LDPEVLVMVLMLSKLVAPNPPTKLALKPKFDRVVVPVLPEWVAPNLPTEPALKPEFDWVVGCEPAELPEFYCPSPTPRGANVMFRFVLPMLRPMAAMGIPQGDVVTALGFAVAAAAVATAAAVMGTLLRDEGTMLAFMATVAVVATLVGGKVGVQAIVGMAQIELGLKKLCEYLSKFCWQKYELKVIISTA
jgi:hypothetical protein